MNTKNKTKNIDMNYQDDLLKTMLITANVGTIFEESSLLELWFNQLKTYLVGVQPQFVAIHCQEVGGKNFANSMKDMSTFTDKITGDQEIADGFNRIRIFLDEDYTSPERFTALGSIYLVHNTVKDFKIYNFETNNFDAIQDISVNSFNQDKICVDHVEKVKFPQDLFPECRWSRKGFMRTRWLFNNRQMLDLVNIHLFHDASNLVAMETTPSPYALDRQRALDFTLRKISEPLKIDSNIMQECQKFSDQLVEQVVAEAEGKGQDLERRNETAPVSLQVPLFIFGDFNFRLDTKKVIERISRGASPKIKRCADSNEVLQFVYHIEDENDDQQLQNLNVIDNYCSESETSCELSSRKTSSTSNPKVANELSNTQIPSKRQIQQPEQEQNQLDHHHQQLNTLCNTTTTPTKATTTTTPTSTCTPTSAGLTCEDGRAGTPANTPVLMTIGKKLFDFVALDETFRAIENNEWLQEMDIELNSFRSELFEFKISFSPSYPFKEDTSGAHSYMKTRCPAWCDRILFNSAGSKVIYSRQDENADGNKLTSPADQSSSSGAPTTISSNKSASSGEDIDLIRERVELLQKLGDIQYRLLGNSSPMGDHKPVLLYCQLSI